MAAPKVFWDTNILIDFLLERPFESAAVNTIFDKVRTGEIRLFTCETTISTSLYVCRGTQVVKALLVFLDQAELLPTHQLALIEALHSSFRDKEDAILYHLAMHHKMDVFITRDKKDFSGHATGALPVMTPNEFLKKGLKAH